MSEKLNRFVRSNAPKIFATIAFASFLSVVAVWKYRERETWTRLRQIDQSLSILSDPLRLMKLATTYSGTNLSTQAEDVHSTVETRHEAVRALLALQSRKFKSRIGQPNERGTGIDHVYVSREMTATNVYLRLIATPTKEANIPAPEGAYWSMEQLDFDSDGKLIGRRAHHQQ